MQCTVLPAIGILHSGKPCFLEASNASLILYLSTVSTYAAVTASRLFNLYARTDKT